MFDEKISIFVQNGDFSVRAKVVGRPLVHQSSDRNDKVSKDNDVMHEGENFGQKNGKEKVDAFNDFCKIDEEMLVFSVVR